MANSETLQEILRGMYPDILKQIGFDGLTEAEIDKRLDKMVAKDIERMRKSGECEKEGCSLCPYRIRRCKYTDGYEPMSADALALVRALKGMQ